MEHKRSVADLYGVTGVVPPLIPGHDVEMLGEEIDDLAFAFIAPLGADYHDDFGHRLLSKQQTANSRQLRQSFRIRLLAVCCLLFASLKLHRGCAGHVFFDHA